MSARHLFVEGLESRSLFAANPLDPSFSVDGLANFNLNNASSDNLTSVVSTSDGSVYAAGGVGGQFVVARYKADGSLDPALNGTGYKVIPYVTGSGANAIAVQSDGKILVGGTYFQSGGGNQQAVLIRLNADGNYDNTWDGDGIWSQSWSGTTSSRVTGIQVMADGKVVVAGDDLNNIIVARFTTTGGVDSSFGGSNTGRNVFKAPDTGRPESAGLEIATVGSTSYLVVGGRHITIQPFGTSTYGMVARLTLDGSLDGDFGTGGIVQVTSANFDDYRLTKIAVDPSGRVITGGSMFQQATLFRLTTEGIPDTTFSNDGMYVPAQSMVYAVGGLVATADRVVFSSPVSTATNGSQIFALTVAGRLDPNFGNSGVYAGPYQGSLGDYGDAFVQSDGKVLFAGRVFVSPDFWDSQVARITFGSTQHTVGSTGGYLYNDINGNGAQDTSEAAYTGFGVSAYVDLNNNGTLDSVNEPTSYTGNTGKFNFYGLAAGTYTIRLSDPSDSVHQTAPANDAGLVVNVVAGQHAAAGAFGVQTLYTVNGIVYDDANASNFRDTNEALLNGRTVFIDVNNNGVLDTGEQSRVTANGGAYSFKLPPGSHRLRQVLPTGYRETGRYTTSPNGTFPANGIVAVPTDVPSGSGATFNFGSQAIPLTKVYGFIIRDNNGNGVTDSGEPGNTAGDSVYVDANKNGSLDTGEPTFTTGANGWSFLLPEGTHTIRQLLPTGWVQTMPANNAPLTATVPAGASSPDIHAGFFGRYLPPANPQSPFKGSPFAVGASPITIQAEDFDLGGQGIAYNDTTSNNIGGKYRTAEGVDIKNIGTTTNTYRISDAIQGEWMEYSIDVAQAGSYVVDFRVGNRDPNSKFHLELEAPGTVSNITGTMTVPDTNSFDTFTTISKVVTLPAGKSVLRFVFDSPGSGGYGAALDWFAIKPAPAQPQSLFVTPGTINVPEGGNATFAVRLAVAPASNVTVNVARQSGDSDLTNDLSSLIFTPSNWNTPQTVTISAASDADTTNGQATFVVSGASASSQNVTAIEVDDDTQPSGQQPFLGTAFPVGDRITEIQAEDFDLGGQGVAYNDSTSTNLGNTYRPTEGVDIKKVTESLDRYRISDAKTGEWMEYTINVAQAGAYKINFDVGNRDAGSKFRLDLQNGGSFQNLTGSMTVPDTNSFDAFQAVSKIVNLPAGQQVLRFVFEANGSGGYGAAIDRMTIEPSTTTPPTNTTISSNTAAYVRGGTYAGQNFNTSELVVKTSPNGATNSRETYIKFDLSNLASINSAALELTGKLSASGSLNINVFSTSDVGWSESGINWNNKSTNLTSRGSFTMSGTSNKTYSLDVTGFLQAEFAAGRKVVTFVLKADTSDTQATFVSDENASGPKLQVA